MANTTKKNNTAKRPYKKAEKPETEGTEAKTVDIMVDENPLEEAHTSETTYNQSEVEAMIAKAVAEAMANNTKPTIIQNVLQKETISLVYIGCVSEGTQIKLGKLTPISNAGVVYDYDKNEFKKHCNSVIEQLMRDRKLIVVSGMTEAEREQYGVDYKESEILTQQNFRKILDLDTDKLVAMYEKLCPEHKKLIAKIFYSAAESDNRVTLEKCRRLNELSKAVDQNGLFTNLIKNIGGNLAD